MEEIQKKNDDENKEFNPQYPAELYQKRPNPKALLSPLYDFTFKGIFTQETEDSNLALQCFISAVIGRSVTKVILKPNEPPKETTDQKTMTYDISVEFDNGEVSDIEMQAWKEDYDYGMRAEILASRLLNNNAKKGNDWYAPKVYQISIINFHYGKDDNKEVSWYTIKNQSGIGLTDRQNIIFIDLVTIRKKIGTPIEQLTPVEKWGLFFSLVDKEEENEYIRNLVRSEKGIMAAENIVKNMSSADDNWFIQYTCFKNERDKNTLIHNAEKRGREEGLKEGIQQGIQQASQQKTIEFATMMLKDGKQIKEISKYTGLTSEEILELQKSI